MNPKITPQAAQYLEKGYLRLRQNDLSSQKTSYRVTVRQLESLIRLSEAIAKINISPLVTKEHVESAYDLLSKTIISVHQPDVIFEANDEQPLQEENAMQEENPLPSIQPAIKEEQPEQ